MEDKEKEVPKAAEWKGFDPELERMKIREEMRADAEKEDSRRKQIRDLCSRHLLGAEFGDKHIESKTPIDVFRGLALEKIGPAKPLDTPVSDLGMSKREKKEYSLLRAINSKVDRNVEAGFEREVSAEIEKRWGRPATGFYVPTDVIRRDLTATATTGSYLVGTQHLGSQFVDWLYNLCVVRQLGATVLSGLTQNIQIPAGNAGHAATWVAEANAASESAPTFRQITMAPNSLSANADYSKQLLLQGIPSVEGLIQRNLAEQFAIAEDAAALVGSGGDTPQGIVGGLGVGAVTATTATYAKLANFIRDLWDGNVRWASPSEVAFVTTPAVWEILVARLRDTANTNSGYILQFEGGESRMFGYKVVPTANITAAHMIFGRWADLMIGEFGAMDVTVDPYTQSKLGVVQITALRFLDIALRNGAAFSVSTSVT